jgi:hypothetical protein
MIVGQSGTRAETERQAGSVTARIFAIALQALGVAALGAIVYFAFLQPSDPNPLSGIEVEGDIPAGLTPGEGRATGQRNRRTPAGPARRGDGTRTLADIRLIPVPPGDAIPGQPGTPVDGDGATPTGEQYDSAVARILGRVAGTER